MRPRGPLASQPLVCEPGLLRAPPSCREEEAQEEVGGSVLRGEALSGFPAASIQGLKSASAASSVSPPAPQEGKLPGLLLYATSAGFLCGPGENPPSALPFPHWERNLLSSVKETFSGPAQDTPSPLRTSPGPKPKTRSRSLGPNTALPPFL